MPRNMASVPSVTTSEGRPSSVTSAPLKAPQRPPQSKAAAMASDSGQSAWMARPKITLDSARMLADRVAFLHEGVVVTEGTFDELRQSHHTVVSEFFKDR